MVMLRAIGLALTLLLLGSCTFPLNGDRRPRMMLEHQSDGERWLYYQYESGPQVKQEIKTCPPFELPELPELPSLPPLTREMENNPEVLNRVLVDHLGKTRKLYREAIRKIREAHYGYQLRCKALQG